MHTSVPLIALVLASFQSSADAAAGLRQAGPEKKYRALNQSDDNVVAAMQSYYKGQCHSTSTKRTKTTTLTCSMPGSTSTLIAQGAHTTPQTLEQCTIGSGGNQSCESYTFASHTMTTAEVIAYYFPSGNRSGTNDYDAVLAELIPYHDGACSISLASGNTVVACSMPGSTSTFNADSTMDQTPTSLQVCTIVSGGNTRCNTYYFNGSMTTSQILTEAFGNYTPTSTAYYQVLSDMIPYYAGSCSITLSHGNTDVSCSMSGGNAKLTAQGTQSQQPMQLMTCTIGSGGNQSCNTYNFNGSMTTRQILAAAFPSN